MEFDTEDQVLFRTLISFNKSYLQILSLFLHDWDFFIVANDMLSL